MTDLQFIYQRLQVLADFGRRQGGAPFVLLQLQHGAYVFFDGQATEYRRVLRQVRQPHPCALVHGHAGNGRAVDFDTARIGGDYAYDHVAAGCSSEESRVGKEGVSTCRYRWSTYHIKTQRTNDKSDNNVWS